MFNPGSQALINHGRVSNYCCSSLHRIIYMISSILLYFSLVCSIYLISALFTRPIVFDSNIVICSIFIVLTFVVSITYFLFGRFFGWNDIFCNPLNTGRFSNEHIMMNYILVLETIRLSLALILVVRFLNFGPCIECFDHQNIQISCDNLISNNNGTKIIIDPYICLGFKGASLMCLISLFWLTIIICSIVMRYFCIKHKIKKNSYVDENLVYA